MTSHLNEGTLLQGGKYQIVRSLGQGGFGITYEAIQVALKRKVAIKEFFMRDFCLRETSTSAVSFSASEGGKELVERFRGKFIREAQMIAGFDHPNIVKIYDVFEENGTAYYVMEYLEGGSLEGIVKNNGALPEPQALDYIRQVGSALSYLHQHNSLHFDVKPENILINKSGKAILIDFGVSKHYDETGHQTSSTPVGLSRGYAPLEQYQAAEISTFTPATDIYALGATLYRLVSGELPPAASEVNEEGVPTIPGASPKVMSAIRAAMQPRRKDRPQSIEKFMSILSGTGAGASVPNAQKAHVPDSGEGTVIVNAPSAPGKTEKTSFVKTSNKEQKKKSWAVPVVFGLIAVGVVVSFVLLLGGGSKTTEPEPENPNGAELSTPTTPITPAVPVEPEKPEVIEVQSLSLNKTTLALTEGETATLTATVKPTNATDKKVTWKSTNPKIATVSSSGKITAKTPGNTSITAQCGGKEVSCDIVVKEKPAPEPTIVAVQSINLSNESLTLTVGDTKTLNVTFTPSNATDKGVEWQSTNSGVASVNNNGLVTAKAAGSTTIIASAGGKVKYCNVTVKEKVVPVIIGANGEYTVNGVQFKMIRVSGGTFRMGPTDSDADSDESPVHSVTLSGFWIGETEVTQELWTAVMGSNPSNFKSNNQLPVECVSYEDCKTFISKLNSLTGKSFRLPTEAEWEFAARGGNNSRGYKYSGSNNINDVAWHKDNSGSTTHPVKTKRANELGIYDMSGNVWEWCNDWYGSYSSASVSNPGGPGSGSFRVYRGGSWGSDAGNCRVTYRNFLFPGGRGDSLGVRLAL